MFAWLLWLPFVLYGFGILQLSATLQSLMMPSVALGAFSPLAAAVILILKKERLPGLKRFFKRTMDFRIKPIYYLLAIVVPTLITAAAHYLVNIMKLDVLPDNLFPEDLKIPVIVLVIPYFIFILIAGGGQEEFGWRGFAQEPMQQRHGILRGSILLGLIWSIWHLPLWFMPGEGHTYYSFLAFSIYTTSISVIIGWYYNASDKKMVIPWLIHAAGNVAVPFFPVLHLEPVPQPGYWVWTSLNVLVATSLSLWYMRANSKLSKAY